MADVHEVRLGNRNFTLPGAEAHYAPDLALEPVHLELELHVDVEKKRLQGRAVHTLRARSEDVRRLELDAVDFLDVSVRDPDGGELTHAYDGDRLAITWASGFAEGETRRLEILYAVEDPSTGLFFSGPSDAYPDAPLYAATDHETERARHWLPTIDLPSCRPTLDVHLRAASRFTSLGPGELVSETENEDGTKTVHWRLEQGCPSYLTCFAIGDFIQFDDGKFESIPLAYFTTDEFEPADLERSFGRTRDMLAWMTEKLDHPFPYPKYFQFALPGFGGAMENISLVSWDDQFVLDEKLAREWSWLVDLVNVHEMAHSYFGDMIVCRDYAHAWLKESWATYIESLWLEDVKGADEAAYHLYDGLSAYIDEADNAYVRPIATRTFDHSWSMYDRHLYPGGAVRLHMLRAELGDDAFFRGVRAYVQQYAFDVVETEDFRRSLEEASGRSLAKFFDQWIYGKGYPKLKVGYAHDAAKKEITFTIEQTQANEKKGIGLFDLPLVVGWVADGELCTRTVELSKAKHIVVMGVDKAPDMVRVDPYGTAVIGLEFNPGDPLLRKQLVDAPDVRGRILAAQELCKTGRRQNLEAVRDAYLKEPFWGVRIQMAKAIVKADSEVAIDVMLALLPEEQDPQVLETLIRLAGRLRDPRIRDAIEARLDGGLDLYRARAAAYDALGMQRDEAPWDRIVEAAGTPDRYGFAQSAALRALGATRRVEAVGLLTERLREGETSNRARPAAAGGLGVLARGLRGHPREEAVDALAAALRDPFERVRKAATMALGHVGDLRAVGALRALTDRTCAQEKPAVRKAIRQIQASQEPRAAGLEKKVDDLLLRLRKAEDQIERLGARPSD